MKLIHTYWKSVVCFLPSHLGHSACLGVQFISIFLGSRKTTRATEWLPTRCSQKYIRMFVAEGSSFLGVFKGSTKISQTTNQLWFDWVDFLNICLHCKWTNHIYNYLILFTCIVHWLLQGSLASEKIGEPSRQLNFEKHALENSTRWPCPRVAVCQGKCIFIYIYNHIYVICHIYIYIHVYAQITAALSWTGRIWWTWISFMSCQSIMLQINANHVWQTNKKKTQTRGQNSKLWWSPYIWHVRHNVQNQQKYWKETRSGCSSIEFSEASLAQE